MLQAGYLLAFRDIWFAAKYYSNMNKLKYTYAYHSILYISSEYAYTDAILNDI